MKKIIDGALYNTESARLVGSWSNGYGTSDFKWCRELLYRTNSGKYFLHGKGGPMSIYCEHYGNTQSEGEMIVPLTFKNAREWAEENLEVDEYAAEFGVPEEANNTKVPIATSLTPVVVATLKRIQAEKGRTLSDLIDEACRKAYDIKLEEINAPEQRNSK